MTEAELEAAITAHNTSETAHADIRADIAAANLCAEKRLAPLEALARTLDTLNPKGEGTVTATTYGTVTLPKNAANGRLGLVVKGRTVTQIEPNGRALCNDISAFNRNKYDPIITQNTDNIEVEIASSQVHAILGWSATNISPGDYLFLKAEVEMISEISTITLYLCNTPLASLARTTGRQIICGKIVAPDSSTTDWNWHNLYIRGKEGEKFRVYRISQYKLTAEEYALSLDELNNRYGFLPHGTFNSLPTKITSKDTDGNTVSKAFTPNVIMRSLPNDVADEFDVNTGTYTQRVSGECVLQTNNFLDLITSFANVDHVRVSLPESAPIFSDYTPASYNKINVRNFQWAAYPGDDVSHIGKWTYGTGGRILRFIVAKGTTLAQARAALAGTVVTYELTTPVTAQYPAQFPKCKGGGTLTAENVFGDVDYYGDGVTVEGLTFSEIVKVTKVDLENGLETDVTDTCTLNKGGDGFTSTALAATDICWYELRIDPATTTLPAVEYSFYDSRFVAVDDTDGKAYRWKIVTTNGTARIVTEEIT